MPALAVRAELPVSSAPMSAPTEVWVSFDCEHDAELYEELLEQSRLSGSGFVVCGGSQPFRDGEAWEKRARLRIDAAEHLIVICGEHTSDAEGVCAELRIAREQATPYLLLWGRREIMCAKPTGTKPSDGMYSWTAQIIRDQLALAARAAARTRRASALKRERHASAAAAEREPKRNA